MAESNSEFIFYQTEDQQTRIQVRVENETVWLTQIQMAELFQTTKQNVSLHIQNIFKEKELRAESVVKESLTTAADGKNYATKFYNLDVIISVGYRVKSHRGTQFRIWATQRLREYIVKGFALDDARLKEGKTAYFDELLARIRDIRASEKNFYRKILDIYATAADYDPKAEIADDFFATVQNKLHYGVHGRTAAELIAERADAAQPNMGLTSWKGGRIQKAEVTVAKNYLNPAELQARSGKVMYMRDWRRKLDDFLRVNDREILQGMGKVSHQLAEELAHAQFEKFRQKQLAVEAEAANADFEEAVKKLGKRRKKP